MAIRDSKPKERNKILFRGIFSGVFVILMGMITGVSGRDKPSGTSDTMVDDSSMVTVPDDFTEPSEALKHVKKGGRLRFTPGTYRLTQPLEITRNMTVTSTTGNPKDVLLESKHDTAIILKAANARIQGLSLQNLGAEAKSIGAEACTLYIPGGTSEVVNCEITGNSDGIQVTGDQTNPGVSHCKIHDCGRAGVLVSNGAEGQFTDCEMYENTFCGLGVRNRGTHPVVEKCKIYQNERAGVFVWKNGVRIFRNNTLENNVHGDWDIDDASKVIRTGNTPNK